MVKDGIVAGFLSGALASIVKSIINMISHNLKIVDYAYADLAASLFVKAEAVHGLPVHILGVITDIFLGASLGIALLYLCKLTGISYLWLKSLIYGSAIWLAARIILNTGVTGIIPRGAVFGYTSLVEHWVFGLVTLYMVKAIFPLDPQTISEK